MKKIFFSLVLTIFIVYCILSPAEMAKDTASGLTLWYHSVVPTLLPFSILSYIIIQSNLYHALFSKINSLLPNHTSFEAELLYPLILGFFFGFPIGAKLLADLYDNGHISNKHLSRYAALSAQFGPAFIINYVGIHQFNGQIPTAFLLISIYLPSIVMLVLFLFVDKVTSTFHDKLPAAILKQKKPASRSYINFKIIDTGIINGFETMLRIAGYIVLFSILSGAINMLPIQQECFTSLVTGLLEVTTGVNKCSASSLPPNIIYYMVCGIVSFGGLCGFFQVKAILKNAPFHSATYLSLKLINGAASVCIAYFLSVLL